MVHFFSTGDRVQHGAHVPYDWIIGGLGVGLALIILSMILCVSLRMSNCLVEARNHAKDADGKISHKCHIIGNLSLFCGCGRYICIKPVDKKQTDGESSNHQITIPKASSNQPSYWTLNYIRGPKVVLFAYTVLSKNMHSSDTNSNVRCFVKINMIPDFRNVCSSLNL